MVKNPALAARLALVAAPLFVSTLPAQSSLPPPFPRTNATKLLETEKIVVWDIVWPKGQPPIIRHTPGAFDSTF